VRRHVTTSGTDPATRRLIVEYLDGTWFDYRVVWLGPDTLAKHFGYWDTGTRNHADSLLNMNRQMAARVRPQPGELVLDAGCGVGGSSLWLVQNYGVRTVGISLSTRELAKARRYAAGRGLDGQCTFLQQDYLNTAFADNSFDIVWAQESLCHSVHKDRFIAEAYRVLKPGGRLVIEEWYRTDRPFHPADEKLFHDFLGDWAIPDLPTRSEMVAYCADAGFGDIAFDDITANLLRSARHLYILTTLLYPGACVLRGLRLRTKLMHGNIRAARGQWRAHVRQLWIAALVSARKPPAPGNEPAESGIREARAGGQG
jgi:tocopherol O-methyltransferase